MKDFLRKHEYKLYIVLSCVFVLWMISWSVVAHPPHAFTVKSLVINSDVHFEKEQQGVYDAYTPEKLKLAKDHKVILFFKADWCPSCRTADETLNTEFAAIPKNIAILKVSYDTELELRKRYGVTIQHTFVQVDEQGDLITKWLGGISIGEILEKLK
jgi:thiol-disulfide isomerase/thioredoxin